MLLRLFPILGDSTLGASMSPDSLPEETNDRAKRDKAEDGQDALEVAAAAVAGKQPPGTSSAEADRRRPEALTIGAADGPILQSAGNGGRGSSSRTVATSHVVLLPQKILTSPCTKPTTTATATAVAAAAAATIGPPKAAAAATPPPPDAKKTGATPGGGDGDAATSTAATNPGGSSQTGLFSPPPAPTSAATTTTPNAVTGDAILSPRTTAALTGGRPMAESLATLHRGHIAALQLQEGTAIANEVLRVENNALKRENDARERESRSLRDEFSLALQDSRAWCRENEVLGQQYAKAFEAKTAEVFDRNAQLERDNESLREENACLRAAAAEAARRHSELLRETKAWRHENAILHEEYSEHLITATQVLAENASLKDQVAVSNHEYGRVTARNKARAEDMAFKVQQALRLNGGTASTTITVSPTIYEKLLDGALRSVTEDNNNNNNNGGGGCCNKGCSSTDDDPRLPAAGRGGAAGGDGGLQLRRHKKLLRRQTRQLQKQELEQMEKQRRKERRVEELANARDEIWSERAAGSDSNSRPTDGPSEPAGQQRSKKADEEDEQERQGKGRTAGSGLGAADSWQGDAELGIYPAPAASFSSSLMSSDDDDDGGSGRRATAAMSKTGSEETVLGRWSGGSGASQRSSSEAPSGRGEGRGTAASDAGPPTAPPTASSTSNRQENNQNQSQQQRVKGTPAMAWRDENAGWLKKTSAWRQASRVPTNAQTSPEERLPRGPNHQEQQEQKQAQQREQHHPQQHGRQEQQQQQQQQQAHGQQKENMAGVEVGGGDGGGGSNGGDGRSGKVVPSDTDSNTNCRDGADKRLEQRRRVLSLPQRLALQLESCARRGYIDTKAAQSEIGVGGVYTSFSEDSSDGGSTEEDI